MRTRIGRIGAIGGLVLAIVGTLGRRVWWSYRANPIHARGPRPAIVARQPVDRLPVPRVTPDWEPVVAKALPVEAAALSVEVDGTLLPVVWIDAHHRPDITDLPRVLHNNLEPVVVATQWLAAARQAILVVTFVEPVVTTWALRFDLERWQPILHVIADTTCIYMSIEHPPARARHWSEPPILVDLDLAASVRLTLTNPAQLHALLAQAAQG